MSELEAVSQAAQVVPAVIGAAGGGLGVLWLARVLFKRMIDQYDKKHDEQSKKLEAVAGKFEGALDSLKEKLGEVKTKIALLEQALAQTHSIRSDVNASVRSIAEQCAKLEASLEAKLGEARRQVDGLADDVGVAHRRIELVANGDTDISKVTKPIRRK